MGRQKIRVNLTRAKIDSAWRGKIIKQVEERTGIPQSMLNLRAYARLAEMRGEPNIVMGNYKVSLLKK